MIYRDPKKESNRLKGEVHAARCRLIDAEKSGEFARIMGAKRRLKLAEATYSGFSKRRTR